jgi:lysozyme family protein
MSGWGIEFIRINSISGRGKWAWCSNMTDKFLRSLRFVLKWEGGLSNDPDDRGGLTNRGITQATYDRYRRAKGLPLQSVAKMTEPEMREIYYRFYWQPVKADEFAYSLALALFDTAVNMGVGTAIKLLQRAINDLLPKERWVTVDGKIGEQTLRAAKSLDPKRLALQLSNRREERYYAIVRANPTQQKFLRGWLNRLNDLRRSIQQS